MENTEGKIHICIDRILPVHNQIKAAQLAARENPKNQPKVSKALSMAPHGALGIALLRKNLWQNGRILKVRFLDGDATQQRKVEERAHQWEQYANITFKFGDAAASEIRISFSQEGSWSAVGTDSLVED